MRPSTRSDTLELLGTILAFWRFLFDRVYRERTWEAFRAAQGMDRALMVLYALVATMTGPLALAIVIWAVLKT